MAATPISLKDRSAKPPRETLREQRERIRARVREHGSTPIDWPLIEIKGEPLSVTIMRERRGDFDD